MSKILPNVIIAGAPKCGTSSLYFWLAAHPDACASKSKETFYFADEVSRFNKSSNFVEHGLKKYSEHFEHCSVNSKVIFEATAPYIYYKNALEQIAKLDSQPKVIFLLREPSRRTLSQYLFQKHRLGITEMPYAEYIEQQRILRQSEYIKYLELWVKKIGRERIKVFVFEEFLQDVKQGMKDLSAFLNLDGDFYENFDFTVRNETIKVKNKKLHQIGLKMQPLIPHWVQKRLLPLYLDVNSGGKPTASQEEKDQTKELKKHFAEHNKHLKKLFPELDFSSWN